MPEKNKLKIFIPYSRYLDYNRIFELINPSTKPFISKTGHSWVQYETRFNIDKDNKPMPKKFTLDTFMETVTHFKDPTSSNDDYDNFLNIFLADFSPVFRQQVASGLIQVPDAKGHSLCVDKDLKAIAQGQEPKYGNYFKIERSLAHAVLFSTAYGVSKDFSQELARRVYAQIEQYLQTLTIQPEFEKTCWMLFGQSDSYCGQCGERVTVWLFGKEKHTGKINIEYSWFDASKFSLSRSAERESPHMPLVPCEYCALTDWRTTVEFKDTTVYACDWFRLPKFTAYVDKDSPNNDINCVMGCIKETLRYAKDHNFVKLQVGNSSPYVYANKQEIVFGRELDEDTDISSRQGVLRKNTSLKEKGYVCTDLWAACLIDKKTLTDILIKADPNCDAPAVLDDWLKEAHVVKLKVDPGVYEVCFEGYSHMFDNKHQKTQNALKDISVQGYIHKVR